MITLFERPSAPWMQSAEMVHVVHRACRLSLMYRGMPAVLTASVLHSSTIPPELLRSLRRRFYSLMYDLLEIILLQALQTSISCAIGTSHILAKLRWSLLGRLHQHLARAKARLLGQSRRLFFWQSKSYCARNEMLDHGEEVRWSRTWSYLYQ
jgi:hypothetical protein